MASDFYRLTEMDKHNPNYAILLGERANGKSGAVKERVIEKALEKQTIVCGLIRRLQEDIKASVIKTYFNDNFLIDKIKKLSKNKYNYIHYYQRQFYFAHIDKEGNIEKGFPFCEVFALSDAERYKSSAVFPNMEIIIFEEFTTANRYINGQGEVEIFMNLCSTLLRLHKGTVYMIANKLSRVCPYFSEWSLRSIPRIKEGEIHEYIYQDSQGTEVKICVEMCASPKHKKSGMFFGRIGKQIDSSAWSCKEYPHLIGDLADYDKLYSLSLEHLDFSFNILLLCHKTEDFLCVYIYPKKMQISERLITEEYSSNILISPTLQSRNKAECLIHDLINQNKLVFPCNLVGEDFYSTIKNMKKNPFLLY